MRTIDIHTHVLTEETMGLLQKESSKIGPKLTPIDADFAVLDVAGVPYRPFPRGGFDIDRRFADLCCLELYVVRADGSGLHILARHPRGQDYSQPAVSVDGKRVAFSYADCDPTLFPDCRLAVVDLAGRGTADLRKLPPPAECYANRSFDLSARICDRRDP